LQFVLLRLLLLLLLLLPEIAVRGLLGVYAALWSSSSTSSAATTAPHKLQLL
jgi:hypothetical protein